MNDSVRHTVYAFEGFRLDAQRHVLFGGDGQPIPLTPRLFDTLLYFVERAGQLLMKEQLLEALWPNVVVEEHNLNKTVSELRRILGEKPGEHRFIITKPGRGYCFVADVSLVTPRDTENVAQRETSSEPKTPQTDNRWQSRNLRLVGLAGFVAAVSVLGAGSGFVLFGASGPPSVGGLEVQPLLFEKDGGEIPHVIGSTVWSPDSQAIAFAASPRNVVGPPEPYVLRLDGSSPNQLTQQFANGLPKAWTPTGHVVLNTSRGPYPTSESAGLFIAPAVGGEPEPLFTPPPGTTNIQAISADGSLMAALRRDEQGIWGVWVGSIANKAIERYEPAPFAATGLVNVPSLSFSPDGRKLLLFLNPAVDGRPQGEQGWLLPYPPERENPPRRVLETLPSHSGTPQFSWLPDNRHIAVSAGERGQPSRVYLADTESGRFRTLAAGASTAQQFAPLVSPDGRRLVFSEVSADFDIVTMNVRTAAVTSVIDTNLLEEMPAWATDGKSFVYVTRRNGESEIWLHKVGDDDRPLVTPRHFPPGTTAFFMAPQLSTDGTRVMYLRVESDERGPTGARLWMSSVTAGPPMRLRDRTVQENAGSWSPDSAWYVYTEVQPDGRRMLKKARTSDTSEPETLAVHERSPSGTVPIWSPDGRWILFDGDGLKLISSDGSVTRELGVNNAVCAFAHDEELLYCIESSRGVRNLVARSFDGTARVIGPVAQEHQPAVTGGPALRLSLTPDGEGLTYSTGSARVQLLLVDGLADVPLP